MLIALDANVWLSERLLRSAVGAAFLHAARRLGATLLLPDSTRDEVLLGVLEAGSKAVSQAEAGLLTVQALTGTRPEVALPSPQQFREAAEGRLAELADLIRPCEITLALHSRALERVNHHRAPAATREQYRDCLLWECLMEQPGPWLLVSSDGDFLDKGGGTKVLAQELTAQAGDGLTFCSSLTQALRILEPQLPPLDQDAIADAIEAIVLQEVLRTRDHWPFALGARLDTAVELYATERPDSTTVVFRLSYSITDLQLTDGVIVGDAVVHAKGECLLSIHDAVSNLKMDRIDFTAPDGMPLPGGMAYLHGGSVTLGTRQIPYTVRASVPLGPA